MHWTERFAEWLGLRIRAEMIWLDQRLPFAIWLPLCLFVLLVMSIVAIPLSITLAILKRVA